MKRSNVAHLDQLKNCLHLNNSIYVRQLITLLPNISIRHGLFGVLIVQCIVAGLLVISDLGEELKFPLFINPDDNDAPILPGDQVRRYNPQEQRPGYTNPDTEPTTDLPTEFSDRLEFSIQEFETFGKFLLISGGIENGDARRFRAFLVSLDEVNLPVAINSPGGIVDEALEIGKIIRNAAADTVILPRMICLSACPYMLAGGKNRRISNQGAVGLHQHYYETPSILPAYWAVEDIQYGQGEVMEHLILMGVDPSVMIYSLNTPPEDIYYLVETELIDSRLATEMIE